MRYLHFFFRFTRQQRKGIIALFVMMVLLQVAYFVLADMDFTTAEDKSREEKEWMALQGEIDALKAKKTDKAGTIYPFNPNFISDYKGYSLGMTVAQIDRLHKFRESGKFINSAEDFKNVTKVPDSLLAKLSPYFKFPDWVKNKDKKRQYAGFEKDYTQGKDNNQKVAEKLALLDINEALEEDLDKVYGIGPAFAKKIMRRRAQLGAFVSMEQMNDFSEFSPEAIQGLKKRFTIGAQPAVTKLNINTASLNQLASFPYFNRSLAKAILTRRSMKGKINRIEELLEINEFPVEKEKIIALYLEF